MCSSRRLKPRAISYPVQYRPFRYPSGAAFGSGKSGIQQQQLKKQNSSKSNDFEEFWCAVMDFSPPGLLVHRLSQGQIRAVSVSTQFCRSRNGSRRGKARRAYACMAKGFDEAWAHFCPSKPCLPLSIDVIFFVFYEQFLN